MLDGKSEFLDCFVIYIFFHFIIMYLRDMHLAFYSAAQRFLKVHTHPAAVFALWLFASMRVSLLWSLISLIISCADLKKNYVKHFN